MTEFPNRKLHFYSCIFVNYYLYQIKTKYLNNNLPCPIIFKSYFIHCVRSEFQLNCENGVKILRDFQNCFFPIIKNLYEV